MTSSFAGYIHQYGRLKEAFVVYAISIEVSLAVMFLCKIIIVFF